MFCLHDKTCGSLKYPNKKSVTLNSVKAKELVGQTPTQPPHSMHSIGVKDGRFELSLMVCTGQISMHF